MNKALGHEGGIGWTARILLAIVAIAILAAVALGIYGGTVTAPHRTYRVVIPSSRFQS